jgi:Fur family ferric uptake transcriptional regulator
MQLRSHGRALNARAFGGGPAGRRINRREEELLLKERNLRMTRQRQVILEELRATDQHPSADALHERVKKKLPRISLGTVYRNLEILTELGEIRTIALAGSLKRFDGIPQNHYHMRCMRCDRLVDAPMDVVDSLERALQEKTEFRILSHQLEFTGICPDCQALLDDNA